MEALIPGLPDDVAEECLLRVSYTHLTPLGSVSQRWRRWVHSPDFHRRRRLAGISRPLLAFTQPPSSSRSTIYSNVRQLTIFDLTSGTWHCLPPRPPDIPIPLIYVPHLAGLGHCIVAMTWCNEVSYVHTYNLLTGRWRVRAPMPGPPRSKFTCFSDGIRRVLVTGRNSKNDVCLQSGIIFDLEKDAWEFLPDLTDGLLQLELLTNSSRYWSVMDLMDRVFCMPPSLSSTLVLDGMVYGCEAGKLCIMNGPTWQPILDLPQDANFLVYLTVSREGRLVMSSTTLEGHFKLHTLILEEDNKSLEWRAHKVPIKCRGAMHDTCWLEI